MTFSASMTVIDIQTKMEWDSEKSWMIEEQAKEELRILEAQYPNRFDYLKSFLFSLQSQQQILIPPETDYNTTSTFPTPYIVLTQESSSCKRKSSKDYGVKSIKDDMLKNDGAEVSIDEFMIVEQRNNNNNNVSKGYLTKNVKLGKRKDRVDVVLQRAQACLQKIKRLKSSLLSCN